MPQIESTRFKCGLQVITNKNGLYLYVSVKNNTSKPLRAYVSVCVYVCLVR